jgi:tetratricopeptide (TPR) repeat protein
MEGAEVVEDKPPPPVPAPAEGDLGEPAPPPAPAEDVFEETMSVGLDALARRDYALARESFGKAMAIRPNAAEARSGLSQAEEGLRNAAIAGHRDRASELERQESWRAAEAEYASALALDGSLRFAQEGKSRAAARAVLWEKLEFQRNHPERLSDARALEEAARLAEEAREVENAGTAHQEAVRTLDTLVASYSRPVNVEVLSDALTDVTILRVGRLGKFETKAIELRPGRYVAVGSRPGFRDVRVEFAIEAGKPVPTVRVRCEEAI